MDVAKAVAEQVAAGQGITQTPGASRQQLADRALGLPRSTAGAASSCSTYGRYSSGAAGEGSEGRQGRVCHVNGANFSCSGVAASTASLNSSQHATELVLPQGVELLGLQLQQAALSQPVGMMPAAVLTDLGGGLAPASDPVDPPSDASSSNSSSIDGTPARECNTNADCPKVVTFDLLKGPRCSAKGQCVQCNVDSDCPARGLICVGKCDVCVANSCMSCRVDDDCEGTSGLDGQGPYCMAGSCKVKGKKCSTDAECKLSWKTCFSASCPEPKCGADGHCDSGLDGL
eukprot:gene7251-7464_t